MKKARLTLAAATAATLALTTAPLAYHASASASTAATPGVTSNSILVGTSLPESGPAGAYAAVGAGTQAYFKYINANGGVNGRKITFLIRDDGYDPSRTVGNVQNLVLVKKVFALADVLGTANNLAALPFITAQGVPLVYPATGSSAMATPLRKDLFPLQVSYTNEGKTMANYLIKTLHLHKLGVFYQNDDFGKEGLAAVTAQASKDGGSVTDSEPYALTDTDFSGQVLKLQQAGVDAVAIFAIPSPAASFIGTAAKVGLRVPLYSSSIASDPAVFKILGLASEGVYFTGYAPLPTSSDPKAVLYRKIVTQYGDPVTAPVGSFSEVGVGAGQIFVEALRRAGKNLTRQSFLAALETFNNYQGSLLPSVTYNGKSHYGATATYTARVHNTQLVQLTGYQIP